MVTFVSDAINNANNLAVTLDGTPVIDLCGANTDSIQTMTLLSTPVGLVRSRFLDIRNAASPSLFRRSCFIILGGENDEIPCSRTMEQRQCDVSGSFGCDSTRPQSYTNFNPYIYEERDHLR